MEELKIVARRQLADHWDPPADWVVTTLAERGQDAFGQLLLRASQGDPHHTSTPESAQEDFQELIAAAGAAFDPSAWFAVADQQGDFGVVLPQLFPDDPTTGTLFYLAVVPERRGQGRGRQLHCFGLGQLARRGAMHYVGSAGPANAPMLAIFRANGCQLDPA